MVNVTAAVDGLVDVGRLRRQRRQRLLAAMATRDLDALTLGRPANIHYASGARQLWTAGARPFAPGCVVLRDTGEVHLMSTWDDGVPADIPRDHLFGLSWNPAKIMASLAAIPGLATARRVGTDALTPAFAELLLAAAPRASIVDGRPAVWAARRSKTGDEITCLVAAAAVAEAGLASLIDALTPGISERRLVGIFAERVARLGVPILASESVACATALTGPVRLRQLATDRAVAAGQLVVLTPGVVAGGYEGGLGRTWTVGSTAPTAAQEELGQRGRVGLDALLATCRAGRTGADLRRSWEATGEPLPAVPLAYGIGLGAEPPVIGDGCGDDAVLTAGAVLAVQSWVAREGVGGWLERELVLIGDGEPEILTRFQHGPS